MEGSVSALLNDIQKAVGAAYLSDLNDGNLRFYLTSHTQELIMSIPDNAYPLEIWIKAASYIAGRTIACSTVREAKKTIVSIK